MRKVEVRLGPAVAKRQGRGPPLLCPRLNKTDATGSLGRFNPDDPVWQFGGLAARGTLMAEHAGLDAAFYKLETPKGAGMHRSAGCSANMFDRLSEDQICKGERECVKMSGWDLDKQARSVCVLGNDDVPPTVEWEREVLHL